MARSYKKPEKSFSWAFVANYCPLVFMEESGRNLTPDKLQPKDRKFVQQACDAHLHKVVETLKPIWIVGVGKFAEGRAKAIVAAHEYGHGVPRLAVMPHPSPASPAANRNWSLAALASLEAQGVPLDRLLHR